VPILLEHGRGEAVTAAWQMLADLMQKYLLSCVGGEISIRHHLIPLLEELVTLERQDELI
jgi:HEPN domain-containing protein